MSNREPITEDNIEYVNRHVLEDAYLLQRDRQGALMFFSTVAGLFAGVVLTILFAGWLT